MSDEYEGGRDSSLITHHSAYSSSVSSRRMAWLFAVVAVLHLLPIWRVHLVPTVDGPSHVYNARVLRELAAGAPEFGRVFAVNPRPNPNWLGYLVLLVFPERVLLSIIVLMFLAGCW